jgi:predicted small secreted protein
MEIDMKALIAALIALPLLVACNTIEGIGTDVEKVGEKVKETAQDNK